MEGAPILHLRATSEPLTAWEGFGAERMWRKGKRKAAHWPPSLPLCLQPRFPSSRASNFSAHHSQLSRAYDTTPTSVSPLRTARGSLFLTALESFTGV